MQTRLVVVLCLTVVVLAGFLIPAQAFTIVDTGQPTGSGTSHLGKTASDTSWLYGQFTLDQGYAITGIEGWIFNGFGNLPLIYAVIYTDTIREDGLHVPGTIKAEFSFSVPPGTTFNWYGVNIGPTQTPDLNAGTYWVGFEVRENHTNYYSFQAGAPQPLPLQVIWNGVTFDGGLTPENGGWGFMVYGTPLNDSQVPLPGSLLLLATGLLGVAAWRRRDGA